MDADDILEAAKRAYDAYGRQVDYKNYQGLPMPKWEELSETIQLAWKQAALAAGNFLMVIWK